MRRLPRGVAPVPPAPNFLPFGGVDGKPERGPGEDTGEYFLLGGVDGNFFRWACWYLVALPPTMMGGDFGAERPDDADDVDEKDVELEFGVWEEFEDEFGWCVGPLPRGGIP